MKRQSSRGDRPEPPPPRPAGEQRRRWGPQAPAGPFSRGRKPARGGDGPRNPRRARAQPPPRGRAGRPLLPPAHAPWPPSSGPRVIGPQAKSAPSESAARPAQPATHLRPWVSHLRDRPPAGTRAAVAAPASPARPAVSPACLAPRCSAHSETRLCAPPQPRPNSN